MTQEEIFINKYSSAIIEACLGTPIFPSVKMAQLILESGWGKSVVGNNLFGIKATGKHTPYWKGDKIYSSTTEYVNGVAGNYNEPFRNYASQADSIRDHSHLLMTLNRYKIVLRAKTPEEQAIALKTAGYATDLIYADSLIKLIKQYNLKTLDEKKK